MQRLVKMLSNLHPEIEFSGQEKLIDDGLLDSIDIVTLVTDLNSEYGISIGAEDIVRENFETRENIIDLVRRRGGDI